MIEEEMVGKMALAMARSAAKRYGDPEPVNPDLSLTKDLVRAALLELEEGGYRLCPPGTVLMPKCDDEAKMMNLLSAQYLKQT